MLIDTNRKLLIRLKNKKNNFIPITPFIHIEKARRESIYHWKGIV